VARTVESGSLNRRPIDWRSVRCLLVVDDFANKIANSAVTI